MSKLKRWILRHWGWHKCACACQGKVGGLCGPCGCGR